MLGLRGSGNPLRLLQSLGVKISGCKKWHKDLSCLAEEFTTDSECRQVVLKRRVGGSDFVLGGQPC